VNFVCSMISAKHILSREAGQQCCVKALLPLLYKESISNMDDMPPTHPIVRVGQATPAGQLSSSLAIDVQSVAPAPPAKLPVVLAPPAGQPVILVSPAGQACCPGTSGRAASHCLLLRPLESGCLLSLHLQRGCQLSQHLKPGSQLS